MSLSGGGGEARGAVSWIVGRWALYLAGFGAEAWGPFFAGRKRGTVENVAH